MIICCKKLNLLKKQEKIPIRTKKKELRKTNKVYITWKDNLSYQTKHTSQPHPISKISCQLLIQQQRISPS
jgi:hypothetical protein